MVDYASGGGPSTSKTSWVCPNDRHLALRAKLRKGWSVKTQQEECFPRQSVKLDEHEQDVILAVIKRAEELEHQEQERLGRIIERLDIMRRNAVGTGVNQCILCGTQLFFLGLITTSCLVCYDCKKAICQKCAVECLPHTPLRLKSSRAPKASQASSSKKGSIWRCKICAETREMWKKSGAWFVKGVPKYILPPKKPPPPEGKYSPGRRVGYEKSNWARALSARPSEGEEESSSDEDRATKFLASRKKKTDDKTQNQYLSLGSSGSSSSPFEKKSPGGRSIDSVAVASDVLPFHGEEERTSGYKGCKFKKGSLQSYKRETSESSESGSSSIAVGHYHRTQSSESGGSKGSLQLTRSSTSYNGDQALSIDTEQATTLHISAKYNYSRQDSQLSLLTTRDWCSESDKASLSGSSLSGYKGITEVAGEELVSTDSKSIGSLGSIEFTLIYDSVATSIHVSLHRAKNLKPMDINGLADPFCKLNLLPATTKSHRLRTRTVHKTRNPEFNETLTFYGVTESDMITRALHILVLDDDKYGYDFMGEARFPLAHLRPDTSKQLNFYLEKHFPVENEEFIWGVEKSSRGQILITLCFSTRRKALLVGIVRCTNLPPMDNNGLSDPFVKLCLKPDAAHKKCKTSVKWKNLNPVFHEEFYFETKMQELAQQTLVISVWDKDYGKSNDYLGCLELGCKSKGERLRHWIDMIKFPDHKHEGWHNLCDDQPPPQYPK